MGTVLINDVTKDDINAALIRIQKQIGSGGGSNNAQGTSQTIQNIQIQNSGGSSSDLTQMVSQLRTTISEQNQRITMLENTNKELQRNLLDIQSVINNGVTGNITTVSFDDATRMLNFVTDASTGQVSIPDGAFLANISGPSFYLCKFRCKAGKTARLSFCIGNAHERDVNENDSLRVMSYSVVNLTVEQKQQTGSPPFKAIVTVNGFCTENSETPNTIKYNMGDIIIVASIANGGDDMDYWIFVVTDNTHYDFPIWWKIFVNQTTNFELGNYTMGGWSDNIILWNSRYGFNSSFNGNNYIDLTKSYSHFQNLANIQGGGGGGSKLDLKGQTYATNTYADDNPKVRFMNSDESQNISLTFTDYDSVQAPASLTLNGNQGGEYFIAPNIKTTGKYYGRVNLSTTAGNANGDIWIA